MRWDECIIQLNYGGTKWKLLLLLYTDDADLCAESDKELDRMEGHFCVGEEYGK